MKTTREHLKKEKVTEKRIKQNPDKPVRDMTIEEAREAEKAFNEELRIFQKVTEMNRTKQKGE